MKLSDCLQRIEKYLQSAETQPRIVNAENISDLATVKEYFCVGKNIFIPVERYCNEDENPRIEDMLDDLKHQNGNVFLTGFTTQLMLLGEEDLKKLLSQLIHYTSPKSLHIIVLCYQCSNFLSFSDVRLSRLIYNMGGEKTAKPCLIFISQNIPAPSSALVVDGVNNIAKTIETNDEKTIYVRTDKHKSSYKHSLYSITVESKAFEALCKLDVSTNALLEQYGTDEQWAYALDEVSKKKSWTTYFDRLFGGYSNLDLIASNWRSFDNEKRWMYFIALKLFGAKNSWCLSKAAKEANTVKSIIRQLFRSILSLDCKASDYWGKYKDRKELLLSFGNPDDEVLDYCAMVKSKDKDALYYLTDNTRMEKETIFETLDKYGMDMQRSEVENVLLHIYPDLYAYLSSFQFKNELLDQYFQTYKYEKVINKIFSDFEKLVEEQAQKREYNLILPARTEKVEAIEKTNSQLYFMDAMGVEYLSFIMKKCREKGLYAKVTVCRSELPSLTFCNKEFVGVFESAGAVIVPSIKKIDDIKHHGEENFDYQQTHLPIHLIRELEIIDDTLANIKTKLAKGTCTKAVMIADHGASRLAVISNKENKWEMQAKGEHSGRCCPKNEIDEQPDCATDANDFWVLANYDRFKGGKKASVEVHGGATLEEVTVPIIEITYSDANIEVIILTPEITFSFRKKAEIILFSKTKLENVTVSVSGKYYDAVPIDENKFSVTMPDLRQAKEYFADVYSNNNLVASGLKFNAQKEGSKVKDLL